MNGNELQTLGIILIIGGVLCLIVTHFLLRLWKKRILRNLNGNQNNDDYEGGSI